MRGSWKRSHIEHEEAFLLYCEGKSDYAIAARCGISIYTVEAWKRKDDWKRRKADCSIRVKLGVPGIAEVEYTKSWEKWEGEERAASGLAARTPRTRGGLFKVKGKPLGGLGGRVKTYGIIEANRKTSVNKGAEGLLKDPEKTYVKNEEVNNTGAGKSPHRCTVSGPDGPETFEMGTDGRWLKLTQKEIREKAFEAGLENRVEEVMKRVRAREDAETR